MPTKRSRGRVKGGSITRTTDPSSAVALHSQHWPAAVYGTALAPMAGGESPPNSEAFVYDTLKRMKPRDPMEEMLIHQALFAHVRVMRLTAVANRQTSIQGIRTVHEYADRASNTFRRLMLALAEYRRPRRGPDSFTAIRQANFAGQQVVQNHEIANENATNEQGCGQPALAPALPAQPPRPGQPQGVRPARETVEAVHRPANRRRKGSVKDELAQAR